MRHAGAIAVLTELRVNGFRYSGEGIPLGHDWKALSLVDSAGHVLCVQLRLRRLDGRSCSSPSSATVLMEVASIC